MVYVCSKSKKTLPAFKKTTAFLLTSLLTTQSLFAQTAGNAQNVQSTAPAVNQNTSLSNEQLAEKIKTLLTARTLLKTGSTLFETSDLEKFYNFRSYRPVWINQGQASPFAQSLKEMIYRLSYKHGLIATDYWTDELESYFLNITAETIMSFELTATRAYIQLAKALSDGRIEPTSIDNDIRFRKRVFVDHEILAKAVSLTPGVMSDVVETVVPQHQLYKDLAQVLAQLNSVKDQGGYRALKKTKVSVKLNARNSAVPELRERLKQMGYELTGASDVYDQELSSAIQEIQSENGYQVSADLKSDSGIWGLLSTPVEQRITQVQATLEKLRWLPKTLEKNMIFVNTNSTEIKIYENGQVISQFKTINGKPLRRTPMMKNYITRVIFNPTWTATDSIVLQDKLSHIQEDVNYLTKLRMSVVRRDNGQKVDPKTLDWMNQGRKIVADHLFVMEPGPTNALGTVKFPLVPDVKRPLDSNGDDIFMHYTDDPKLFMKPGPRQFSSGCVRLEKAHWFASYILKNVPGYDEVSIQNLIAKGKPNEVYESNKSVPLAESDYRAVYLIPLTVEKTPSGHVRFMKDYYLQDRRIYNAVMTQAVRSVSLSKTQVKVSTGVNATKAGLRVMGEAGPSQLFSKVIAVRCDEPTFSVNPRTNQRVINRKCSEAVNFNLNETVQLPNGRYILGFENSVYPGFVYVQSGRLTVINLQKIQAPSDLSGDVTVRVLRDFNSLTEQKKIYFEKFYMGRNLFHQSLRDFGDYYVAGLGEIDVIPQSSYAFCSEVDVSKLELARDIREHAQFICQSYNNARSMMDYADLFRFSNNGTYQEAVADYPGDVFPRRVMRQLVAAPLKPTEFVSVMPGAYRISGDISKKESTVVTAGITEQYPNTQRTFSGGGVATGEESDGDIQQAASQSATQATHRPIVAIKQKNGTILYTNTPEAYGVATSVNDPVPTRTLSDREKILSQFGGNTDTHSVNMPAQSAQLRMEQVPCSNSSTLWRTEFRSYCTSDATDGCDRGRAKQCADLKLDLRFKR